VSTKNSNTYQGKEVRNPISGFIFGENISGYIFVENEILWFLLLFLFSGQIIFLKNSLVGYRDSALKRFVF